MNKLNNQRQAFLITFFPNKNKLYEEKEVNGFILIKHIVNGDPHQFEVAIYPKDHFTAHKDYTPKKKHPFGFYKKAAAFTNSLNSQFSKALAKDD